MIDVLIVCEGNVCRSPSVERVLATRLDGVAPGVFRVTSAGTDAVAGSPMFPRSVAAVLQAGGDPAGFAATPLTEVLPAAPGAGPALVLTMERAHRAAVLDLAPGLLRRTFTLREFVRLVTPLLAQGAVGADFWSAFPRLVTRSRLATAPAVPEDDDIADPIRGDEHDHAAMQALALAAIDVIVACAEAAAGAAAEAAAAVDHAGHADDESRTEGPDARTARP